MEAILKVDSYSSKLQSTQDSRVLSECESNGDCTRKEEPTLNQDNNVPDPNEKDDKSAVDGKAESVDNGVLSKSGPKRTREKSKNLLSKLRRRKRRTRTSSDSDTSDVDQSALASSSDEINSDVSETEEDDALSEENDDALSDDGLSDNNTDDEVQIIENATAKEEMNGHTSESSDKTELCDEKGDTNHNLVNGERHAAEQADSKVTSDKDSAMNSNSATTITTNTDSISTFDETNGHSHNQNSISHMAQLKKCSLKPDDVLNMLIDKEILASIKVCCDWLRSNPDIVRICAKSSRTLLKRVAILLNLIDVDTNGLAQRNGDLAILSSEERLKLCVRTVPLPEDIDLKGLHLLEDAHRPLDWQMLRKHRMNKREETLLRTLKLIEFGHHLTSIQNSGVQYDQTERSFVVADANPVDDRPKTIGLDEKNFGPEHSRGKLMRHMGKLWLKAEVRALENQLRSRLMSPYLVPDHEALTKHTPALKRLVYTKKFIVVIPSIVVSALDEMKRVSSQAREATRWLETQLRRGSRFLRAQRPQERLALPLIKGPRPKDKEAWLFFQIIECCHYLTQQAKMGFTGDGEAPVVTLLTGCNLEDRKALTFSPDGLAKSAGVNLEHIESFQMKWKSSSKSHG
ncbi:Protein SMG5 [Ooceraea biroi]|nr:Protein SMG5 [Ooceraea biroi]